MHPAVFAKMAATMDDVAGGRMGFNIVSAGNKGEYTQMGLWPENFEEYRYEYCEEWVTAVKRLWTEDNVTMDGKYFKLDECQSWPHPVQSLPPIVCATTSERGWQFVAQHCTAALFGGKDPNDQKKISRRVKEVAARVRPQRRANAHADQFRSGRQRRRCPAHSQTLSGWRGP